MNHPLRATTALLLLLLAACGSASTAGTVAGPDGASAGPLDAGSRAAPPFGGHVTDAAGAPVAGVLVEATSLDRPLKPVPEKAVLTDGEGRYEWYGLAPGRYRLQVSLGARSGSAEATTAPGGSVEIDLVVR
ncbi:carboxypeptidase-like regulatory domain-containing protein [Lapillicoccus jejuensis]|uniref:Carboxypeptidase family protein n=1 Tax=Lapillicoccus jejuensis TaxID=402171 RepID=A0A542E6J3_9MICO|nr:carboxypeptidase-like regulatory domain-containing protein [Lapillicoccus jejuensis]TQJ10955.1 carboxypeptidase family protein [Lapillicoccus jejuensis]